MALENVVINILYSFLQMFKRFVPFRLIDSRIADLPTRYDAMSGFCYNMLKKGDKVRQVGTYDLSVNNNKRVLD